MFFQCISVMVLLCLSEPITADIPLDEIRHLAHLSYHFSLNSLSGDLSELAQHHVTRFQTLAIKVLPFLETIPAEMSQESQAFIKSLENEDAKNTSSDKESLHIRGMWALLHVLLQSPHAKRSGEFLLIAKTYLQETSLTEISACFKDIDYQTIYEYDSANIARLWLVEMHRKKFPSTTLYDGCTSCYVAKPTKVERNDDKVLEYLKATFQLRLFKGSVYTLFASYYESVRTGGFDEKGDQNTTSAKIYKEFASHATRLIPMLAKEHDKLTEEEEELVTKEEADCGYHCGLWKLFHTLLQKSEAPGATAEAIAEYIPYVTTGKVYSQFFKDVSQKVASGNLSLMDANAARLWLWNVHNVINEFAGHAFYPSKQQCETCVVEAIVNEPAVLEYLQKTYSNFPQVTSQKEKAKRIIVFFIPIFVCSVFLVMLGYIVRRELAPEKQEEEIDPNITIKLQDTCNFKNEKINEPFEEAQGKKRRSKENIEVSPKSNKRRDTKVQIIDVNECSVTIPGEGELEFSLKTD